VRSRVWTTVRGCVAAGSVDFQDNPVATGQEEEAHAESPEGVFPALLDCLVVPMQPDLGQQRWEAGDSAAVDLVVEVE
jgi:hypothetical protein